MPTTPERPRGQGGRFARTVPPVTAGETVLAEPSPAAAVALELAALPPKITPPRTGPGRPRKPGPPQGEHQERLADQVEAAELRREEAAAAYAADKTVALELGLLQANLEVASCWSAYLRAEGNHTHGLAWADLAVKHAARVAALRELEAVDLLKKLVERQRKEHEALGQVVR
jgi:hypothetical protein